MLALGNPESDFHFTIFWPYYVWDIKSRGLVWATRYRISSAATLWQRLRPTFWVSLLSRSWCGGSPRLNTGL